MSGSSPLSLNYPLSRRRVLQAGVSVSALGAFPGLAWADTVPSEIVWGKSIETTMIDPHTALVGSAWQLQFLIYETLTTTGDGFSVQPGLAQSWDVPEPTKYIFHLRDGVAFSNGRPMTSEDVAGSIARVVDPKFGSWWASQMGSVKSVTTTDAKTVTIELSEPFTPLLASLAASMTAILPMKEIKDGSFDPSKDMMGTGPFMVSAHQQNDFWTLLKNPHYWGKGLPKTDKITVRIITDDSARLAALQSGAVDIANFENPDAPLLLKSVANVKVVSQITPDLYTLVLNAVWPDSPFRDERLRQAVFYALDRQQIRDVALSGQGEVSSAAAVIFKDGCPPPGDKRNVAKAKELVAAAGGLSFEMIVQSSQAIQRIAQVIQQNLADAGINANLAVVDEGVFVDKVFVHGKFQAAPLFWSAYADPGMVPALWSPSVSGATGNYVKPVPKMEDLIRAERRTPNGSERTALLNQICTLVDESAQMIPLVTKPVTVAFRSDRISATIQPDEGYNDTLRHIAEFARLT
jgi:peptide/nickel transport system substrate-binding protein